MSVVTTIESTYSRALRDRLLRPTVDELASALPDAGEALIGASIDLARDATANRCDVMLSRLHGAVHLVTRLRTVIVAESQTPNYPEAA